MKRISLLLAGMVITCGLSAARAGDVVSLAGEWRCALDAKNEVEAAGWFKMDLPERIRLPGTTDEAGLGTANTKTSFTMHLSRVHPYYGAAWYQREIVIPDAWKDKTITVLLERTKHSRVWLDADFLGEQDSLATAHVYEIKNPTPGKHRLTCCINNAKRPPTNGGHQLSDDTQTNWNGIIGRIELRANGPAWIESQRVDAKIDGSIHVQAVVRSDSPGAWQFSATIREAASGQVAAAGVSQCQGKSQRETISIKLKLDRPAKLWSEFSPDLYTVDLQIIGSDGRAIDSSRATFAIREFAARGTQFCVNGKPVMLRGKHDACVFPLTGYPPMDAAGWVRVFKIAKEYGLNHYRFHSWCPPEAAFIAADQVGIYLQPELPNFGGDISKNPAQAEWCLKEGRRVLEAYGNHPSFAMLALGNELGGGREVRADLVRQLRQFDSRHLFAQASNYDLGNPHFGAGDDYWTTFRTRKGEEGAVRGSYAHVDAPLGHIQAGPAGTTRDYSKAIENVPVPVIGHEIGQYQTYPDFNEIGKYTGVLRAWNFEVFRRRLQSRGMLDQTSDFTRASGALSVICYREEIEAALRTRGFGGFQLLDLQDFPGQGTALVGILDAFMDSKGLITPQAWREFCCETVPLAIFPRYTWTTAESFSATIKVANYGPETLAGKTVSWKLTDAVGAAMASGALAPKDIVQGTLTEMGVISTSLSQCAAPGRITLWIAIEGTPYRNRYDLWAYPATIDTATPAGVIVSRAIDDATLKSLSEGASMLLLPEPKALAGSIEGFFASDFWCYPMFKRGKPPGSLGILCNEKHPALAGFPTEFHSNWQWFNILVNSRAMVLDNMPAGFRPIVQVIDNFDEGRNHRLGLIFELRVGKGRLLVCASDLPAMQDKPEARQLLASLLRYVASPEFQPSGVLTPAEVKELFESPRSAPPRGGAAGGQ